MDPEVFKSNWSTLKDKIIEKWPLISADEVEAINGDYSIMITTLQAKYFYVHEEAEQEIKKLYESLT